MKVHEPRILATGYGIELGGKLVYCNTESDHTLAKIVQRNEFPEGKLVKWYQYCCGIMSALEIDPLTGELK